MTYEKYKTMSGTDGYAFDFADFQLEDLKGKKVFVDATASSMKEMQPFLQYCGVEITKSLSGKTDYILSNNVTSRLYVTEGSAKECKIIKYLISENEKPKLISFKSLKEKIEFAALKKLENTPREKKVAQAKQIFDNLIPALAEKMSYYYSNEHQIGHYNIKNRRKPNENVDMEGVQMFFDYVAECHKLRPVMEDYYHRFYDNNSIFYNEAELRETLERVFKEYNPKTYEDLRGYWGLYFSVGLVVALFVFADPNWDVEIRFSYGRHDHNCSGNVGFHLSFFDPEGTIL